MNNPALISWLVAASVSMGILSLAYRALFRHWTFFALNRWILLGGTLASLLIPLIGPSVVHAMFVPESAVHTFQLNINPLQEARPASHTSIPASETDFSCLSTLAWLVYGAGVTAVLGRFVRSIMQLIALRSRSELHRTDANTKVWVQAELPTFSFGQDIYLNVQVLSLAPDQLASIRRHEEVHVLQKHSIDNVFMELVSAVFWFNPFVKVLAADLKDVHEFLADRWATGSAKHSTDYQELLVALARKTPPVSLAHPFSDSQFVRRIVMLNKTKTNAMENFKLLLLAPVAAAAIFVSSCVDSGKNTPAGPTEETARTASGPVISGINWEGNHVHSDDELNKLLGIAPGDRYDAEHFQEMLFKSPLEPSVVSLYMDNGYLFFSTDVAEKQSDGKVELTVNVSEDEQVWINNVTVKQKGGGNALASQVQPLLDVKKGQLFNRSLLLTSQEKVAKSGVVNPDSVAINPTPLPSSGTGERKYVDIEFVVQPRSR